VSETPAPAPHHSVLRALWQRRRRLIVATAATLLVAGAFLLWGPIGLGNGPLSVPAGAGGYGFFDRAARPTVYVVPLVNSGGAAAVIDGVTIESAPGYPALHVRSVRAGSYVGSNCTDNGPQTSLVGCVEPGLIRADGFVVAGGANTAPEPHGPALVIELAGPSPRQCTVISGIVLHYHVGIRHYSATEPQGQVYSCGTRARQPRGN
jgi:hypothetical protein